MNNLEKKYHKEVAPALLKLLNSKNIFAVPNLKKISLNVGISQSRKDANFIEDVINDIKLISGQAPIKTKAKKAISGFKIRQGQEVGVSVTLRGKRMWDFAERLISAAIPRIKDFQGIEKKNFDKQGNLNYSIKEQLVFPEISHDDIRTIFSFQINVHTSAKDKESGLKLFKLLGFPLVENEEKEDNLKFHNK